jgi:hypothetical protein
MKNSALLVCCLAAFHVSPIYAQEAKEESKLDPCAMVSEEIIPLRLPNFDQVAMWKKTSGLKGIERPRALLPVIDGGQIAIGTSVAYDEKTGLSAPKIQMVRTDRGGKVRIEKWLSVKDLKSVSDAALLKNKIVVMSHLGSENEDIIGLNFLNGIGEEKGAVTISDSALRLIPKSIMSVEGGVHMVIAAQAISRKSPSDSYSVLIWVDKDGRKVTQKEYLPGVMNRPEYVGRLENGEIVMTGRVRSEKGNDAGWILRLSPKGEIIYQRPYSRGGDSVIRRALSTGKGSMIVVGDALPSLSGEKAAWIMKLTREGEPVWQKYLTGKYSFGAVDIVGLNEGRINVLLSGKPSTEGGRQFARIVTLSADGVLMGDESFIEGSNAIPVRMVVQEGKRYLLGLAETGFSKIDAPEELRLIAYDTWLMGLPELPLYKNICAGGPERVLDDAP